MKTKSSVHRLHLNKTAFEIVARALYIASLRQDKVETLPALIENFLARNPGIEDVHLAIFTELPVLSGDILLCLRVSGVHSETLSDFRAKLCNATGRRCTVRDVIIFACSSTTPFPT